MSQVTARFRRCILLAGSLALALAFKPLHAQPTRFDKDTPASVQAAGKNTVAMLDDYLVALKEARAVAAHLAADSKHAGNVLAAARKNDNAALVALLKADAPNSTITVVELKDWTATLSFSVGKYKVTVCGSNELGCGGNTASVGVK